MALSRCHPLVLQNKMTFQLRNIHEETLRYALSMEMRKRERMNMHTV